MAKIFITRPIPPPTEELLGKAGHEVVVGNKLHGLPKKKLVQILENGKYDGLLSFLTDEIDREVIDAFGGKVISNYAVGFNNIDVSYAKSKGIIVTNTTLSTDAVAEFTATLILSVAKRIVEADAFTRDGKFKTWDPMIFLGSDLKGKTLGVIGTGRIGGAVARIMRKGFGMNIIYYDIVRNDFIENECGAKHVPLEDVFKLSDVVSIHTPLLDSTRHLVSRERLSMMKKEAVLINTARGPIVDEVALIEALEEKTIRGAALDVYEFEPKIPKKLRRFPNVILTPHIASATIEARTGMSRMAADNIIAVLSGKPPISQAV